MKTKSRNLIISFLLTLAMLLGVFAMTPLTASAMSITPTPQETPAETIYVGGVALNKGQYVKNGETTATTGEPDWEESGFAFYASSGTFHLSDYEYEGTGYTHDTSEKSVIYSEGKLEIILHGKNSIKNTADKSLWIANGIRAKGNLIIDGPGSITINAPYAICGNNLVKFEYGRTVIPSATVAIKAGGNFIVNGGYVELHSTQPIDAAASFISGGSFTATADESVFKTAPSISVGEDEDYMWYICTDVEGTNQVAYDPENITQYKYFAVLPPTPTEIDSISVSGVVLPALGGKVGDASYAAATCGTGYFVFDMYVDKLVGDTWVALEDTASIVAGVKYRVVLGIDAEEGYTISADIAGANVLVNGQQATKHEIFAYPDYNSIDVYYEFSYTATSTPITSISVSNLVLPTAGQTAADWDFNPGMLTFGGNYEFDDCGMEKYTGTEWVAMGAGDTTILTNVKYRFFIELSAAEGYSFSPELTSDDVTIGEYDTKLLGVDPSGELAAVAVEFSYEASVTDYGITIAKKNGTETVGVLITPENCTDVLGDGTVSYDPTTNTLTLNGYKYEGEGVHFEEQEAFFCLMADVPTEGLTIALVGDNKISVSGSGSAGMIFFEGEGDDLTIKGNGSLTINAVMYGIALQADNGRLKIEDGDIDITITGTMSVGIQAADFFMMDADLKITTAMLGIAAYSEDGICINGGSLEIGTAMGGYAFVCVDFEHMAFIPIMADLSGYVGAYKMTAGVNQDGSDATDFNEAYLSSYKYVKIAHVHTFGTEWKSDASNHWNVCACGGKGNVAAHVDNDGDGKCDACEYQMSATPNNPDDPNNAPDDPNEDKDGLGTGAIVGIVLGSVAVAGIGGFAIFWFVIKKKSFADLIAVFKKK